MEIAIPKEIADKLRAKADDANISPDSAALLILSEFVRASESRIYTGTWRRGNIGAQSGMRYVIDWPFQPGFVKLPGDKIIDLGKRG